MIERQLEVQTSDGPMTTFEFHPEEGGPFPVVLYMMDAPSIRPALKIMASRLATAGYYVLMPFLYYRNSPFREFDSSDEAMHERRELMQSVTREGAIKDAEALLAHAAGQTAADCERPLGAVGFCMSGPLVMALAQQWTTRIGAIASVHGAWVVTDKPNSPHRQIDQIEAELYFAWADNDPTATPEERQLMDEALRASDIRYRIDLMSGAEHGFAPPGGARYHHGAAEKHWERVHDLFQRNL